MNTSPACKFGALAPNAVAIATIFGAFITCAAFAFDSYVDWQWTPLEVADTNAAENVRHQNDMTVPVHGPWLTLPSETGMSVTWITRVPCAGGIEYREKGTTNWVERWQVKYGHVDYSREIQHFRLDGLKPATEYEYRLLSNLASFATPYHMVLSRGREIYSFKTVDPKRDHYKVFLTADVHGSFRLILDPMIKAANADDSDFFFLLGDNVEDGAYHDFRYYTTFGYLDDIVRKWGKEKPTIFIRGNHDVWGANALEYGDYFPQPDGKTYYAFRQGPCFFVALDTMWQPKEALQTKQWKAYLAEQAEWLQSLKKTQTWKDAQFRIVMLHVAPWPETGLAPYTEILAPVFNDTSRDGRIHALISGHHHAYCRVNPGLNGLTLAMPYASEVNEKKYGKWMTRTPCPLMPYMSLYLDCGESSTIDIEPGKLTFKSHRVRDGKDGLYDTFELLPDGKVREVGETKFFPFPEAK